MDTVKVDSAKRVRLPDAKYGLKPLSKTVLEKLYRDRQEDEEGIRVLADAQAWEGD